MNVERLKAEAARLRSSALADEGVEFNMLDYVLFNPSSSKVINCQMVCCIAGDIAIKHDVAFNEARKDKSKLQRYLDADTMYHFSKSWLGLTEDQANWLFFAYFTETMLEDVTKEQAASAIDLLIEQGNSWSRASQINETEEEIT